MKIAVISAGFDDAYSFIEQMRADVNSFAPSISFIGSQGVDPNYGYLDHLVIQNAGSCMVKIFPAAIDKLTLNNQENSVEDNIIDFSNWVIMINGEVFRDDDEKRIAKELRKQYAKRIVPLLSQYAEQHEQSTPNIIFVLTNAGSYLAPYLNSEGKAKLNTYIKESFSGVMHEGLEPIIIMHDAGNYKSAGTVLLSFLFLEQRAALAVSSNQLAKKNKQTEFEIKQLRAKIESEEKKGLLRSRKTIEYCQSKIVSLNSEIDSNKAKIQKNGQDVFQHHVGIAVNRLAANYSPLLVSGFEQIGYAYNSSQYMYDPDKRWFKIYKVFYAIIAGIIFLLLLFFSFLWIANNNNTEGPVFLRTSLLALLISFVVIVLDAKRSGGEDNILFNIGAAGTGIFGALCAFLTFKGAPGIIFLIGNIFFHIWKCIYAPSSAKKRQIERIKKRKIQLIAQFNDPLVALYDQKAKMEVQNGKQ